MNALEALQQALLDPSKYTRVKGSIRVLKFMDREWCFYEKIGGKLNWLQFLDRLSIYRIINDDGSPVEWEVVSESEL